MPTFTIMGSGIGYSGGNYKNDQPGQAAKKAGKALFKKLTLRKFAKYKNKTNIKFVLRMRDRHSAGKTYSYMVTRIKLAKPLLIKKGPIEYEVKYDYKIETCNLSPVEVKTMTGGEYELVGGRFQATGFKKVKGGDGDDAGNVNVDGNVDGNDVDDDGEEGPPEDLSEDLPKDLPKDLPEGFRNRTTGGRSSSQSNRSSSQSNRSQSNRSSQQSNRSQSKRSQSSLNSQMRNLRM